MSPAGHWTQENKGQGQGPWWTWKRRIAPAAAAASDDVSAEPNVVSCSQLGSLEPADGVVPAVANNENGEASEDPTAGDVVPQSAAVAPEPEPDAPSETPA